MSDEIENPEVEEAPAEAEGPLAGARLAAARREQQISVVEVAKELHIDEHKVRALEENDFEMLGAPVFAKGHLRKYAQLVGVNIDDVLADYYSLTRSTVMPPVVGRVRKPAREFSPGPWILAIIVIIVAAAAYWWFAVREVPVVISDTLPAPAEFASVDEQATPISDAPESEAVVELPDASPVLLDSVVAAEPQPEPVADGSVQLSIAFSGECWTEITDAAGQRLFFDLGRSGRSVTVEGRAPLSVLFGNAGNVSLRVNGSDYTITEADRRGQTARLTLYAR